MIPGIWSLAPTSTLARLRLQRAATESTCPTKTLTEGQKRCSQGQNQGQPGTKQGQPGTKNGQGHNWTNAKILGNEGL